MARRFTSLIFSGKPERQKKFGVIEDGLPDGGHDDLESALILAGIRRSCCSACCPSGSTARGSGPA